MEQNEAKRHHYIPQFILRNFTDENGQLEYWDIVESKLEKRNPRSVFMNWHMYRDEENHKDNPTLIESSLSVFEQEISELINKKMLSGNEISLTRAELESFRIFLSLLSFRSDLRMNQYKDKQFDPATLAILKKYEQDENFENLWKMEIEELSKCRTYKQIEDSKIIDPIIKTDFFNDLKGMYMTFVEARGGEFLISDVYPTLEIFPIQPGINIHMHCMYPLSATRLLLLNHIMFKQETHDSMFEAMKSFSQIKGDMIALPKNDYTNGMIYNQSDRFIYRVRKIYSSDVEYINALFLNEAHVGLAFKNKDRVLNSIEAYNARRDGKKDYTLLTSELNKQ